MTPELEIAPGWCAREIEQELPGLRLLTAHVRVGRPEPLTGATPADVERRLRELSNRFRGATAVAARREPVPSAYRVFYRQIGLDPEVARTPLEAALLERMMKGGFLPRGLLADVLLVALLDTGVPIWALDAASVEGPLGIRTSAEGESFGRDARDAELPAGQLVVADATTPLAVLFGQLAKAHRAKPRSERLVLFAVQVAGVPRLYAEEALWTCCSALEVAGHW
ncbi:MAG TPA: phenylalanine--tRNA ligase beta subunit-related protein [Solirubrobacteraceae bacterium]|nr:phenylalanine--tRNA ligase beta subunit-related protein [Solirubrobacteraceae bacterium]